MGHNTITAPAMIVAEQCRCTRCSEPRRPSLRAPMSAQDVMNWLASYADTPTSASVAYERMMTLVTTHNVRNWHFTDHPSISYTP